MKTFLHTLKQTAGWSLALASIWAASQREVAGTERQTGDSTFPTVTVTSGAGGGATAGGVGVVRGGGDTQGGIVIQAIEPSDAGERMVRKELPWLGVYADETSEVLTSQLGLDPGIGLVVTYLAPDSPAAKVGLQKNDVLVEFDGQPLAHPAQLRRLVQTRKEGDAIQLGFYRGGKKQTVTATLAKSAAEFGLLNDERDWPGNLRDLRQQLRNLPIDEAIRTKMKTLRDSLGHVEIDQKIVQEEVRRSFEQARKAYQDALRHATNASAALNPLAKMFEEYAKAGSHAGNNATVTVRTTGQSVKSVVKADETGTIVIVSNPKPHLTAHDKDGKLLFDGAIETPEQRAKVPRDLWNQVEPLLDKMTPKTTTKPEAKITPSPEAL
jgi:Spy/CpxP family protein refolding chaperone